MPCADSGSGASAVFLCKAEWPAQHIKQSVVADFVARLPVFFGGRKRKPEQISRSGECIPAHSQTKGSTLEKGGRWISGSSQPRLGARSQLGGARVFPYGPEDLILQAGLQEIGSET